MNPLFNLLGGQNPMMAQIKNAVAMVKGDPNAMNNPQVQQLIQQHGSAQNAFYALAKQMGIDPNEVMRMLRM
jgi:transketolase N-terminal domain/subunit